ncbi:hypothetical protein AMECASPLE_026420 [Ameca splendens]|uniref:Uncharacterized protein n=1 Tax=Ameca splendens TaxID=208324 RepID=A0ABV0Z3S2_9TELE
MLLSNVHRNGKTKDFPADHYQSITLVPASLQSSNDASWCHFSEVRYATRPNILMVENKITDSTALLSTNYIKPSAVTDISTSFLLPSLLLQKSHRSCRCRDDSVITTLCYLEAKYEEKRFVFLAFC